MTLHAFGLNASWPCSVLLAMAVLLGYGADRWLDVRGMNKAPRTLRHKFAAQYRKGMLLAWLGILLTSIFAACRLLSTEELQAGFALAALCGTNALLNHLDPRGRFLVPKELRAALLLSSGIHLFAWTQLTEMSFPLGFSFATVTLLCFLNCCFVAKWETRIDLEHGQSSLALRRRKFQQGAIPIVFAAAALCSAIALLRANDPDAIMLQATAVALLALPILDSSDLHFENKRVLADASLFLPCLLLA